MFLPQRRVKLRLLVIYPCYLFFCGTGIGVLANRLFQSVFLFIVNKEGSSMKALEEKILKEGKVLPGNILKVGSFLNHQIDVDFIMEMGKEIARIFSDEDVNKILTIETSGIPIAVGAAAAMHVPVVFAKKHKSSNVSGDVYKTVVHSYTHGTDYNVVVEKDYLNSGDNVLIIDDFLANGKALLGLIDIIGQAGAQVVGASCAIEKGFQHGGDSLRADGIRVESLAIIDSMDDCSITFREIQTAEI
mgnify:CR=1 FL=1